MSKEEQKLDEEFMQAAIASAKVAGAAGDVPVGAVIVHEGLIIAQGHNRRQVDKDPTAHAEIEALRQASRYFDSWHIEGTLYVTQEPCAMCAGALVNSRVLRLVYGCQNPKAGAVDSLYSIVSDERQNHRMPVQSGVLATECAGLLSDFFREVRRKKQADS